MWGNSSSGDGAALEERAEVIHPETSLADNGAQGPSVKLTVVGHHNLSKRVISAQDHVAAVLALEVEADPFERASTGATGNAGQSGHTATTMASR